MTEMKDALQNSAYRSLFQQIFNDVTNTIDDPHDEGKIIDEFGGIVEKESQHRVRPCSAVSIMRKTFSQMIRQPSCKSSMP